MEWFGADDAKIEFGFLRCANIHMHHASIMHSAQLLVCLQIALQIYNSERVHERC